MQITKQTIDILKNFSEINSSILVKPGSELETISAMKNILAKSEVTEEFSTKFAIYDLPEFLSLITSTTFEGANLVFNDSSVTLKNGNEQSSKYYFADESTIVAPTKKLSMPDPEIVFNLSKEDLGTIKSMANVLHKPDIAVTSDGERISIKVSDKRDDTSNMFNIDTGEGNGDVYTMYFKTENWKLLSGNYTVSISSKGISHFQNNDIPVEYWIALEPDLEHNF
tara:strand:+ start:558 stop:1232 length:675 start_codon:yes stop_codon:yes gene_type:complete